MTLRLFWLQLHFSSILITGKLGTCTGQTISSLSLTPSGDAAASLIAAKPLQLKVQSQMGAVQPVKWAEDTMGPPHCKV